MQSSCSLRTLRAQQTRRYISEIISYSPECAGSFFGPFRTGIRKKSVYLNKNSQQQEADNTTGKKNQVNNRRAVRYSPSQASRSNEKHGTEYGRRTGLALSHRYRTGQPEDPGKFLCGHVRRHGKQCRWSGRGGADLVFRTHAVEKMQCPARGCRGPCVTAGTVLRVLETCGMRTQT